MAHDPLAPFDAVLLLSFGGPEAPDEVMPFLEHVTRGRGIPRDRLEIVADHYQHFGGASPINEQNRALLAALEPALRDAGSSLPIHWGNRNSAPWLRDTAIAMADAGVRRPVVIVTSAYSSYSGCRQYREDLAEAFDGLDMEVAKVAQFFDSAGFIEANVDAVRDALAQASEDAPLLFITHSIPMAASAARYVEQHEAVAREIMRRIDADRAWRLVYCSRSGAPNQPWLEPDVNDVIREVAATGGAEVVLAPIGFMSDHMEVRYDLDTEAAATAALVGVRTIRAATAGTHPAFVRGLVDLLIERAALARGDAAPSARLDLGCSPALAVCAVDCCVNPRQQRPALCGEVA